MMSFYLDRKNIYQDYTGCLDMDVAPSEAATFLCIDNLNLYSYAFTETNHGIGPQEDLFLHIPQILFHTG